MHRAQLTLAHACRDWRKAVQHVDQLEPRRGLALAHILLRPAARRGLYATMSRGGSEAPSQQRCHEAVKVSRSREAVFWQGGIGKERGLFAAVLAARGDYEMQETRQHV